MYESDEFWRKLCEIDAEGYGTIFDKAICKLMLGIYRAYGNARYIIGYVRGWISSRISARGR